MSILSPRLGSSLTDHLGHGQSWLCLSLQTSALEIKTLHTGTTELLLVQEVQTELQWSDSYIGIQTPDLKHAGINSTSSLLDLYQLWEGDVKKV